MAPATTTNVPVTMETASVLSAPAASVPTTISVPSVTSFDGSSVTQTSVVASTVMSVVALEFQLIVNVPLQLGELESAMQVGSIGVQVLTYEPRHLLTAGMPLGHSLSRK